MSEAMETETVGESKAVEPETEKPSDDVSTVVTRVVLDHFDDYASVDMAKVWSAQDKYIDSLEKPVMSKG